jgi:hypothetical protein
MKILCLTVKREAAVSFETLTAWRHISGDSTVLKGNQPCVYFLSSINLSRAQSFGCCHIKK